MSVFRIFQLSLLFTFLVTTAMPDTARAGGFILEQQSASAAGRGGAVVAGIADASANWYNPANLAWLDGHELQAGISILNPGGGTDFTSSDPEFGLVGRTKFDAEASIVTPVHFYSAARIGDRWTVGLGVNNPFGLVSEWDDVPVTLVARKSSLVTFLFNPNLAYRVNDHWSLALGLDYVHAEVQDFSADVAVGVDPQAGFLIGGRRNLTGDGDAWGWNFATSFRGEGFRAGFTYRSGFEPEIDGRLEFTDSLVPPFQNSPVRSGLDFPAQAIAGAEFDLTDDLVIEADIGWTDWSTFEEIVIDVRNEIPGLVSDIRLRQDWGDTASYRIGGTWRQSDRHQWRLGFFYEESPIPADTLRPTIPDSGRWAASIGYGYSGERWHLDVYYLPLRFTDNRARGDAAEGVIDGTYRSHGQVGGITLRWTP